MSIYPGANVRLIDYKYLPDGGRPMATYNRSQTHTQAGTGSLFGFYSATGRPSSHAWCSYGGTVEQYIDTAIQAEADLDGNDASLSIEVEGFDEPYTTAQIDGLIGWHTWALDAHPLLRHISWNAFLNSDSSKGLGWHRLGIDGNFPDLPSDYAGRIQRGGGMYYSSSFGKVCPGNARIDALVHIVYPTVLGAAPTTPPPSGGPTPPSGGIDVDGYWGRDTTTELQKVFGTPVDGEVWGQYAPNAQPALTSGWVWNYPNPKGSPLIRAMQNLAGLDPDGVVGPDFIRELQRRMGTPIDGELWGPSPCIMELQRRINAGDAPVTA